MIRTLTRGLVGAAAAFVMAAAPIAATALDKPDGYGRRPVTMIVPYGAGGGSDQLARAMAGAMEQVGGLTFQIVNKPGGGGTAAIPDFMISRPDGYTILEHIDDAVSAYASGKISANPAEDWIPLCMTQITFNQIYVRADDERFGSWEDFVAAAKDDPGGLTMANLGIVGSMELITMGQIEEALGIEVKQIAFDKPAERYGALIGGHVDALFEQPGDVRSFLDSGQIKPILTIFDERPDVFAEVPTHREAGADFEPLTRFRGFYVKAGTPEPIANYLEALCAEAFQTESYQEFNRSKYMHLIDSYRDTEGSLELIRNAIGIYEAKQAE